MDLAKAKLTAITGPRRLGEVEGRAVMVPPSAPLRTERGPVVADTLDAGVARGTPMVLVVIALITPNQFAVELAGILLTPIRAVLLVLFFPALVAFLSRRNGDLRVFDMLFIGAALWLFMCVLLNRGFGRLQFAGQMFLEIGGIYIIAQAYIRRLSHVLLVFRTVFYATAVLLVLAVIENQAGRQIWLIALIELMEGRTINGMIGGDRFGMVRATTVFSHPIMYGIFCASSFSFIWYFERNAALRILKAGVIVVATGLSLSSGPLLLLTVQGAAIVTEMGSRWLKERFKVFVAGAAAFYVFINIVADRGLFALVLIFSFSPGNAYYRRLIWIHGIDDVWRHPFFGFKAETWTRPWWMHPSVDNHWLGIAMQGGIPTPLMMLSAVALIMVALYRFEHLDRCPDADRARWAFCFTVTALILAGATVYFFDKIQPLFALVVGVGGALVRLLARWDTTLAAGGTSAATQPALASWAGTLGGGPRLGTMPAQASAR